MIEVVGGSLMQQSSIPRNDKQSTRESRKSQSIVPFLFHGISNSIPNSLGSLRSSFQSFNEFLVLFFPVTTISTLRPTKGEKSYADRCPPAP